MTKLAAAALLLALPAAAQAADPCKENPGLSKNGFVFDLKGKDKESSVAVSFIYESCRVDTLDHVENRERAPRAVRVFYGDQAGWQLWVETEEGSNVSYLTLIEDFGGSGPKNAAWFGYHENTALVSSKTISLGKVAIRDTRAGMKHRTWTGTATIKNAPFIKPDYTEPSNGNACP